MRARMLGTWKVLAQSSILNLTARLGLQPSKVLKEKWQLEVAGSSIPVLQEVPSALTGRKLRIHGVLLNLRAVSL